MKGNPPKSIAVIIEHPLLLPLDRILTSKVELEMLISVVFRVSVLLEDTKNARTIILKFCVSYPQSTAIRGLLCQLVGFKLRYV
jgi:hypothetical protein